MKCHYQIKQKLYINMETSKFAVITAYYKDKKFVSIPLGLTSDGANMKLILALSETGTSGKTMLKFPTSETSFVILSREQLDETLIEVEILDSVLKKNTDIKKDKKEKIIKS